jgi:hypothetical protein
VNRELTPDLLAADELLRQAARAFAYPETPAIADAALARLRATPVAAERAPFWRRWQPLARAAALAVVAAVVGLGVLLAVPQSRGALADFFGLGHVRVTLGPVLGPPPPALSPNSFARPTNLAGAQNAVDFLLRLPTRDGRRLDPGAVYVQGEAQSLPVAILVYEGFDLYETRQGFFGKGGPDPSLIHQIEFDGHPALWVDQGGHIASFFDAEGRLVVESQRAVDRATLLWEEGGVTYRLETSLPQTDAIAVAKSLR